MWHESVVDAGGRYPSKSWCQSSKCGWLRLHGAWINLPLKKKLVRQEISVKNCQSSTSQFSQSCTVAKSMLLCCRTNGWPHTKMFHSLGFILTWLHYGPVQQSFIVSVKFDCSVARVIVSILKSPTGGKHENEAHQHEIRFQLVVQLVLQTLQSHHETGQSQWDVSFRGMYRIRYCLQ